MSLEQTLGGAGRLHDAQIQFAVADLSATAPIVQVIGFFVALPPCPAASSGNRLA